MSEDKMLELQMQVRQNQQDMLDYVKELDGWEEEMKRKEEQLQHQPITKNESLPPVRNSLLKKKKKKKEQTEKQSNKPQKIRGYDYRAWDKFDVEKACEDVEKVPSSDSETDDEWEEQRSKLQAEQLKDQGNLCFKNGKYAEAIDCYTRGLALDSQNALLYANRAMALLKQEQYAAAELDCTECIIRDPSYVKAFSRRASARLALARFNDAQQDYKQVLVLEPNNRFAKNELERIEKIMNPASETFDLSAVNNIGIVKPIYKRPEDRSKMPLTRISIEEIGVEEDKAASSFRKKVEKESTTIDKPALFKVGGSDGHCVDNGHESLLHNSSKSVPQTFGQGDGHQSVSKSPEQCDVIKSSSTCVPCTTSTLSVPASSFQFQADWKILRHQKEDFYRYFKKIDPRSYRQIFGEALDAEILSAVVHILKTFYLRDQLDVFQTLQQLTTVNRFSMTVMFLSQKEKQVLREVIQSLSACDIHNESAIVALRNLYEL